jgi:hypothetical protein
MSNASTSMVLKIVILSLGLSALACGLPGATGSPSDVGSAVTSTPRSAPTSTSLQPGQPPTADSPSSVSGECSNTYYPVVEGATWSYAVTGGPDGPTSYTDTIGSIDGDSFVLTTTLGDITRTQRWSCTADGLVALDFGGGSATLAVSDVHMEFDTTDTTGVTLPAHISPGDTWSQTFTIEGTQDFTGDQSTDVTGDVKYDSTASRVETTTVPAGDFDALRVEATNSMDLTVKTSGMTVPMSVSGTLVNWYAPGVGYVRSVEKTNVFGVDVEITTELTSYNIP